MWGLVEWRYIPNAKPRTRLWWAIRLTDRNARLSPWSDVRFIPLHPMWPGFAVNTVLYATILWLLICGPFALRRFIRLRRGLCPKCSYPAGESPVCTECGKALSPGMKVAS